MPIIGLNLNSINAKINDRIIRGNFNVTSTPTIKGIEKKNILDMDVLSVDFSFETKYEPNIGEITMDGEVLYKTDDMKKILKKWKDEKRLDEKISIEVLNAIFRRCLAKAIELSTDVGLPPPLQFPIVKRKEGKTE